MKILWAVLFLAIGTAPVAQDVDARTRAVAGQLLCPVCQGRTVADSTSQLAAQMRGLIREKLQAGESPEAIVSYFVERYGESILAAPPRRGLNWAVWLLPVLAVGAGLMFVLYRLRDWAATDVAVETGEDRSLDPAIARRLEQEIERLERGGPTF